MATSFDFFRVEQLRSRVRHACLVDPMPIEDCDCAATATLFRNNRNCPVLCPICHMARSRCAISIRGTPKWKPPLHTAANEKRSR